MEIQDLMARYARLVVESGLHITRGQPLLIHALVESAPFVRLVVRAAYEAGASRVEVVWKDEEITRMDYMHQPLENWQQVPAWQAAQRNDLARAGGAILTIDAEDPDALAGVDPQKPAAWAKAMHRDCKPYYDGMDKGENIWCIVAVPSEKWAARVFPTLPPQEAVASLWQVIGKLMRLDTQDPAAAWEAHRQSFEDRKAFLNGEQLDALRFTSASTGTDLTVGLPKGHIWAGGGSALQDGTPFFANMPTEEIFCSPHRERADGVVYSSMPLCCNGEMVEDFSFTFRDGKIVDYSARVGKEVLARLLETDEGAIRLGECALIPKESPIAGTGLIFYNTLFDENAACHLALGAGFSECLEGGLEMDDDQLKAHGVNCSAVHLDFMFGTSDLSVTGIRQDGTEVPVFRNGSWVTEKEPFRFRREIDGWESWGKVFQDLEEFTPLALSILAAQGFPAEPLQPLTPGTNGVFRSGNQVIKLFAPIESGLDTLADWKVEKLLLEKAAELGVQAPRLLAAGACQDRYLFRYLILSYCSSQEAGKVLPAMTDGEKQNFAVRLRTLLDRLHQPLTEPVLERDLVGQVMQNPRLRLVASSLAEELRRRAASISLSPLVLVHGDCTGENLLVEEDGSLTLIDFADSCLAPACYELPPVVFGLFSGDPVLVRAFRGDLSPDVFLDQLVDGLCLHDFAGNILSEYLGAQHIPVQEVESLEQLRSLLRQRLI